MKITARKDSKAEGGALFFTGKPCKRGHFNSRRVSNSNCLSCESTQNRDNYTKTPQAHRDRTAKYRAENPDILIAQALRRKETPKLQETKDKNNQKAKENYANNKEKINEANKKYALKNKERISYHGAISRLLNPEKFSQQGRKSYLNNKTAHAERGRDYYQRNIDAIKEYKARWVKENPEKVRASSWRRKARIKNAEGSFSSLQIKNMLEAQGHKCAACRCCVLGSYDVDHIYPLFLGGSNNISNIQILCSTCNRQKSKKDPIEWANERGLLL